MVGELQINQRVEILVKQGPYRGTYLSKVAEISEHILKLTCPYLYGELVPLRIKLPVNIFFTGKTAAFVIKTHIIAREKDTVPLLVFKYPKKAERIQRREFFRIEAKRGVKYRRVDSDWKPIEDFKETITIDISGGGLKLVINEDLPQGSLLELYLDLPELGNKPIYAKEIKRYDLPDGLAIGFEFIEIDDVTSEKIISWLFDYQRELRQKGLL